REPSFLSCTHRWADVPRAQTPGVGRDLVGFPEIGSGNAAHVAFRGKCSPVRPVGRRSAQILARNPRTPHREETSNTRNVGANYFLTWLPNRSRQGAAVRHCFRCETVCQKPAADAFIGFPLQSLVPLFRLKQIVAGGRAGSSSLRHAASGCP